MHRFKLLKLNFIKTNIFSQQNFLKRKIFQRFSNKINKPIIEDFQNFMDENINKFEKKSIDENISDVPQVKNDIKELLKVIKCPMTESDLLECEDGLRASHIVYPMRNGIYILKEEEALFKF